MSHASSPSSTHWLWSSEKMHIIECYFCILGGHRPQSEVRHFWNTLVTKPAASGHCFIARKTLGPTNLRNSNWNLYNVKDYTRACKICWSVYLHNKSTKSQARPHQTWHQNVDLGYSMRPYVLGQKVKYHDHSIKKCQNHFLPAI